MNENDVNQKDTSSDLSTNLKSENIQNQGNEPENSNATKKKTFYATLVIIGLFVAIICAFYLITNKEKVRKLLNNSCISSVRFDNVLQSGEFIYASSGDYQYKFNNSFDFNLILGASKLNDVVYKICFSDDDSSNIIFQNAKYFKNVDSIELFNINTNKRISSTDIDSMLIELGYHSFGRHSEYGTVVSFDDYPTVGFLDNDMYNVYNIKIEFSNKKQVKAGYIVYSNQINKVNSLKIGKKYLFEFDVVKDSLTGFSYNVYDFTLYEK